MIAKTVSMITCADLKVPESSSPESYTIHNWLQHGFTKCISLCEWESRARYKRICVMKCPMQEEIILCLEFVAPCIIEKVKKYLPPLQIKLQNIKQFVKAMNKYGEGFEYLIHKCLYEQR